MRNYTLRGHGTQWLKCSSRARLPIVESQPSTSCSMTLEKSHHFPVPQPLTCKMEIVTVAPT